MTHYARTWTILSPETFGAPFRVIHRFNKRPLGTIYPNARHPTSWDARTPTGNLVAEGRTQYTACQRLAEQDRINHPTPPGEAA